MKEGLLLKKRVRIGSQLEAIENSFLSDESNMVEYCIGDEWVTPDGKMTGTIVSSVMLPSGDTVITTKWQDGSYTTDVKKFTTHNDHILYTPPENLNNQDLRQAPKQIETNKSTSTFTSGYLQTDQALKQQEADRIRQGQEEKTADSNDGELSEIKSSIDAALVLDDFKLLEEGLKLLSKYIFKVKDPEAYMSYISLVKVVRSMKSRQQKAIADSQQSKYERDVIEY